MPWFQHPVSGQVFEAEGVWAELARVNGCLEVEAPIPAPSTPEERYAANDGASRAAGQETHRRRRARE